ncbi:MAG: hypothetical protein AAF529_10065 [Pseudomonadota bacterium]
MKRLTIFLLWGLAAGQVNAVQISSGYAAEHFYRECRTIDVFGMQTRCAMDNVDGWSLPTFYSSFSDVDPVGQNNDPASGGIFFDRGHDPSVVGEARSEARPPAGDSFFPELSAYAQANVDMRVAVTTQGIQRYENTSNEAVSINVTGRLDGTITPEAEPYTEIDRLGNEVSEPSSVFAVLSLFTTSGATVDTDAARANPNTVGFDTFFNALCVRQLAAASAFGCGAEANYVYSSSIGITYDQTVDGVFDHTFDPAGSLFTLQPGESLWIGGFLATTAMNGGIVDAFNTLTTSIIDPITQAPLTPQSGLVPRSVPEADALYLLFGGFAGLLLAGRRRRQFAA